MELAEQDFKVFEDFLAFLQSHPEIEKCEPDKELIISLSDFEIHLSKRKVFRNQQEISLTKTEYEILLCLIHNANRVLTHSQIYEKVWRELDYGMAQKLVTHHVQAIRRKLNLGKNSSVRLRCSSSLCKQAAAFFYSFALKKPRALVRSPFCHTSKCRWLPVEFPVVPT